MRQGARPPFSREFASTEENTVGGFFGNCNEIAASRGFERLSTYVRVDGPEKPKVRVSTNFHIAKTLRRFTEAACPWSTQTASPRSHQNLLQLGRLHEGFWVNSIFRNNAWNSNYFHWHRNFLAGLSFLIDRGFSDLKIIVDEKLSGFQKASLSALEIDESDLFPFSVLKGRKVENLVSWSGLDRQTGKIPDDFIRPSTLASLATKVRKAYSITSDYQSYDLYLLRGEVNDRRILNERELIDYLSKDEGFVIVDPGKMDYREQVSLFSKARNIVGMHGGALTNTLFSKKSSLIELNAGGHGVRPDFFPFARAANGHIASLRFPSENRTNDIIVEPEILKQYIDKTPLTSNFAGDARGDAS